MPTRACIGPVGESQMMNEIELTEGQIEHIARANGLSWTLKTPVDSENIIDFARAIESISNRNLTNRIVKRCRDNFTFGSISWKLLDEQLKGLENRDNA